MSTTAARRLLLERLGAGETSLLALHFELPVFPAGPMASTLWVGAYSWWAPMRYGRWAEAVSDRRAGRHQAVGGRHTFDVFTYDQRRYALQDLTWSKMSGILTGRWR